VISVEEHFHYRTSLLRFCNCKGLRRPAIADGNAARPR
jgi:hypothetical protein